MIILPVAVTDANIEAELGDTLNLHGVSYSGSKVYLSMTGPSLPRNNVTFSDVTQRDDKGKFTRIGLDSNQEWFYRRDTSRIMNEIKYGKYLVCVSNEPADKSQLGGTNTYKTLEIYFTEYTPLRVSYSGSGTTSTLTPEMHSRSKFRR
ncbi:MAG: hypothetical protein WCF90_06870 [Methanomicrobiales archaeon]